MTSSLKTEFGTLARSYTDDAALPRQLWTELEAGYTAEGRHYHNLRHLEELWTLLEGQAFEDRDAVLFALYYHDLVYRVPGNTNEEESAALAEDRMRALGVPAPRIEHCCRIILATKRHEPSGDADTDLFTDADLGILGAAPGRYAAYAADVRREYALYPDALYLPGRKAVLEHFLNMERIYKTPYLYGKLEAAARVNLRQEWASL